MRSLAIAVGIILIIGISIFVGLKVWAPPLPDDTGDRPRDTVSSPIQKESSSQTREETGKQIQEEKLPWIEDSLTQPLPANASKTRLSLPGLLEDLMPNNAPITGFCAHIGQHAEGMDHVWISVKKGVPAKSFADGTVFQIVNNGGEFFIYIDYGDGLACAYGEIKKPLVEVGQKVKHLDPIGEVNELYGFEAGEIEVYCADANRNDGIKPTAGGNLRGAAVSPFDYLNETDKALLEKAYIEKVINSYQAGQDYGQMWYPAEPFFTNKVMVHEKGKITGEWFLVDKQWNDNDYSLVVFLTSKNKYYDKNDARLRIENANLHARNFIDGTYDVTYEGNLAKIVIHGLGFGETYYALAEITEGAGIDSAGVPRDRMKFELSQSPIDEFSNRALIYQERGIYNPRYDAWKLGNWVNYQ